MACGNQYSPRKKLETPNDFNFPHQPYEIQQHLMESVYNVLEHKGIGIFESPTGSGKSLTLTCAALRWLEDRDAFVRADLEKEVTDLAANIQKSSLASAKADDWIDIQHAIKEQQNQLNQLKEIKALFEEQDEKVRAIGERVKARRNRFKDKHLKERNVIEDTDFLLNQDIDEELNDSTDDEQESEEKKNKQNIQIFYCSRTHSQLVQVVSEVRRTAYGKRIRLTSLASRQQLCIHPQLKRLRNVALLNERCLDMAKNKSVAKPTLVDGGDNKSVKKKARVSATNCPYKKQEIVQELAEKTLTSILDIEDLVREGESLKSCPYYASRETIPLAQLIMLPYQMLLHERTRKQSGIDLRGSIVIIDEAHNLLDTLQQIHSCEISLEQLTLLEAQINAFKKQRGSYLSAKSILKINQLKFITKRLMELLVPKKEAKPTVTKESQAARMLRTYELASEAEFFNIDLYDLVNFCEQTRFAQRLQGFVQSNKVNVVVDKKEDKINRLLNNCLQGRRKEEVSIDVNKEQIENEKECPQSTSIRLLLSFLETFTEAPEDGRVIVNVNQTPAQSTLKYIVLNPGAHFQDVLRDARAVIIAGGTLQPTKQLVDQLFHAHQTRVQQHFYDHVLSDDSVLPFVLKRGNSGGSFNFSYKDRYNLARLEDLSATLYQLSLKIPGGFVIFFPSYEYLDTVYSHMSKSGYLELISKHKRIFREPRNKSTEAQPEYSKNEHKAHEQTLEKLLSDYENAIKRTSTTTALTGAVMLSVVNGKLSEGLNFCDDLGRGVAVVGLPYPNKESAEMKERMKYLDATLGSGSGNEYYENICMKAVNQCIGRSVRHIKDYASVYLLDERYDTKRVKDKLPKWIARYLKVESDFSNVKNMTENFFKLHRDKNKFVNK